MAQKGSRSLSTPGLSVWSTVQGLFSEICMPRILRASPGNGLVRQAVIGPRTTTGQGPPGGLRGTGTAGSNPAGCETRRSENERCLPPSATLEPLSGTDTTQRQCAVASKQSQNGRKHWGSTVHRSHRGRHETTSSGKCRVRQCQPCQPTITRSTAGSAPIMFPGGVTSGCPCSIPLPDLHPAASRRCL